MSEFHERLIRYLNAAGRPFKIQQLTPDASTREYFRVSREDVTMVACVYPEPFSAADQSYLDVTALFLKEGLRWPRYSNLTNAGIILPRSCDTILPRSISVKIVRKRASSYRSASV